MQTIRLQVNNNIYKHLMWFLSRFKKEEIRIIQENDNFISVQDYLQNELKNIDKGDTEFIELGQLENELEETIQKYEA